MVLLVETMLLKVIPKYSYAEVHIHIDNDTHKKLIISFKRNPKSPQIPPNLPNTCTLPRKFPKPPKHPQTLPNLPQTLPNPPKPFQIPFPQFPANPIPISLLGICITYLLLSYSKRCMRDHRRKEW